MLQRSFNRRVLFAGVGLTILTACGGSGGDDEESMQTASNENGTETGPGVPDGTQPVGAGGDATTGTATGGSLLDPRPTATTGPVRLTSQEQQTLRPNELGQIPVLMYHHIDEPEEQFVRTPDDFRADLQWLLDHNFTIISMGQMLSGDISIPAGRHPVVLTFDDSPATNFRLLPVDGALAIDPLCAVGILEDFSTRNPLIGRGGHFAVLASKLFDWTLTTVESDQTPYAADKIRWLADNGYEVGNHTFNHANLAELDNAGIMEELALNSDAINAIIPNHPNNRMDVVTLPYGAYPNDGDDTIFRGFTYQGREYVYSSALLVGANPAVSSFSTTWDPYAIARIQAFDDELATWFGVMEENPGILYTSDGNVSTVTVPNQLVPGLADTLDETKLGSRELIRY